FIHRPLPPGPAPRELSPLPLHDALPIWCTTVISVSGRSASSFCSAISASSQEVISPAKILAIVSGLRFSESIPSRLKATATGERSEEHTSELQSRFDLVCRLLLEKKKIK